MVELIEKVILLAEIAVTMGLRRRSGGRPGSAGRTRNGLSGIGSRFAGGRRLRHLQLRMGVRVRVNRGLRLAMIRGKLREILGAEADGRGGPGAMRSDLAVEAAATRSLSRSSTVQTMGRATDYELGATFGRWKLGGG